MSNINTQNTKCSYHNHNMVFCEKLKVTNFCKMHKYLENKVDPNNLIFCFHCSCVITNDIGQESIENLKCNKCIQIKFCQGVSQKNKACTYKALENDDYCELHQSYKKWKELTDSGIKICSNWIRGCWSNIFDDSNYCINCINKSQKDLDIKTNFIENAVKYNNETNENKMCISCNHIFPNDKLLDNDQCTKCNKNSQKNVDNYVPKDLFEQKINSYKDGAKKRNLPFTLTDIECLKLFSKKCYYCGFINQEHGIGIDRANNTKGYIKSNCVPCCTLCNIMKRDNDLMTFIKICQHIATVNNKFDGNIDYNLFESASNPSFISYVKGAQEKQLDFELELKYFQKLINSPCTYCKTSNKTELYNGAGGIDRKNNLIGYTKINSVSCCKTCNYLKHTQYHNDFINKCALISKYKSLNIGEDIEEKLIDKLYDYLDGSIKKIKPNFLHTYDYYNSRIWTGTIENVKNIKICLEFVESKEQKDLWNYYRYTVSSLETFKTENFIGRTICVLIKDLNTRKYLGIISLSSDIKNLKMRDDYIGWTSDNKFKDKMLNRIMNLSTCVSLQPFGFNFNGGKLLVKLAFSKEIMDKYFDKYNEELLGIITTGLYGKSIQYDRLKEIKFIGMTSGNSVYKISPEITKLCREYLLSAHNKITNKTSKLYVLSDAIQRLKLPRELFMTDNPKGIYFGFTYENSKVILCGKKKKLKNPINKTTNEMFNEWYNRWAIQRYTNLKNTNRIQELEYNCPATRIKIFRQRQIEKLGLDVYKENINQQNKKYYEENKEEIIKKNLEHYHKNKKITNNKYDDFIHLDNDINIKKPDLPNNISLYRDDKQIYIQFNKVEDSNRLFYRHKIDCIDIQKELDKLIFEVNKKFTHLQLKNYKINNADEWNSSKELSKIINPEKIIKIRTNSKIIEKHNNKKQIKNETIEDDSKEFKLPTNISVVKNTYNDYYLQFTKLIDGKRIKKMVKLNTNDFQSEFNNFIDMINELYKDIVQFKKITLYNIPKEYTEIVKELNIEQVDNTYKTKPVMPQNFSICNVNQVDYIQFNKKIDEKRFQYKTKINSYDLQIELENFIDQLNEKYDLGLIKSEYKIINTNGWKTTNKIVEHTDTDEKIAQRLRTLQNIEKKKQAVGIEEYNKQKALYAKQYRESKKEIEV